MTPSTSPWNSWGWNTGVHSLSLLQGIFPTQGSNPGLPHCRWILYQLSHKGSPRILDWVAYPFSRGSSQPRNWTRVSCTAGRFFTNWATREAPLKKVQSPFPGLGPIYLSNLISFHCHLSLSTLGKPDSSWESRSHEVQSLLEDISDACWSSGSCQVEMHCGT